MAKRKYLPDERRVRRLVAEGWAPGDAVRYVMDNDPKPYRQREEAAKRLSRQSRRDIPRNAADAAARNYEATHERFVEGTSLPAYGYSATAGELLNWKPPKRRKRHEVTE